ncbi:DUF881 domain-containing protein [Clostridium swellfunianum]|uniref:DUF881 domain-containing protein n=1 Tax=Clostridium swellfunianum TaxID=1367462 RepID=UPI002030DB7A|nr:DUF881 domain-containing protein [Clostridium swellfunianum]MCM0650409.1 DUF881 domain-containing protein [Clostridium swellfunianum]
MKNNEASLFVFIASIIVGILISLNINFNRTYNRVFLTTKQYQDAYNQRNKLRTDISNMQDIYEELYDKLRKINYNKEGSNNVVGEIQNELDRNKMLLGQMDVEGQGIVITLKDLSNDLFYNEDDPDILFKIVHNYDITYIINDLRNAGAEAIAVNGQRIVESSEVICDGPLLNINGVKIASPFYISAIGNKDGLRQFMLADEHYLKEMINRGINVEVKESENIKIQGYYHELNRNFIKSVK